MNWSLEKPAGRYAAAPAASVVGKAEAAVSNTAAVNARLRLEVSAQTLLRLLVGGQVCAADFRCLDCESKQCVWRILLMSCEKTLHAAAGCNGSCNQCGGASAGARRRPGAVALPGKQSFTAVLEPEPETTYLECLIEEVEGEKE